MNNKTTNLTITGLFVAFAAILSPLPLGINILGIPATFQTLTMSFLGFILGAKKGSLGVFIYLLIGFIGLPVFSNFSGGPSILFGPTGGFLFGFIPFSYLCGYGISKDNKLLKILFPFFGLAICHLLGIVYFSYITKNKIFESFLIVSLPYLLKDIILMILAYLLSIPVKKAFKSLKISL